MVEMITEWKISSLWISTIKYLRNLIFLEDYEGFILREKMLKLMELDWCMIYPTLTMLLKHCIIDVCQKGQIDVPEKICATLK